MIKSIFEKIRNWYEGKYVPPPPNDPTSSIVIVSIGYYQRPVQAKILTVLGRFWLNHWKWIIGTAIAIVLVVLRLIA